MTNTKDTFRPLELEYAKNGYKFKQEYRRGLVAIYSQAEETNGQVTHYEVFIVKQMPEGYIGPKKVYQPARETVPSNEEWGRLGFTYWDLDDAMKKFSELQVRVNSRQ